MILKDFDELNMGQQKMFSKTCNTLLSRGFLARDKDDTKEKYYFVLSFKEYFDEFFDVIDYEVAVDREGGAIHLRHREGKNLLRLKKDETIVLLILRILYHQNLQKTSVNDNVVIDVSDIHAKYDALELKKKINKTDLIKILRLYKRYNLLEPLGNITRSGTKIVLYPTLLMAIDTHQINDVYQYVNELTDQKDDGEVDGDETTDEDSLD